MRSQVQLGNEGKLAAKGGHAGPPLREGTYLSLGGKWRSQVQLGNEGKSTGGFTDPLAHPNPPFLSLFGFQVFGFLFLFGFQILGFLVLFGL